MTTTEVLNKFNFSDLYNGKKKDEVLKIIDDQMQYIFNGRNLPGTAYTDRRRETVEVVVDGKTYEFKRANVITNMILLYPFLFHEVDVSEEYLPFLGKDDSYTFDDGEFRNFMNKLIKNYSYSLDYDYFESLNVAIAETFDILRYYSGFINVIAGHTMSLYTLYQLYNELPEDVAKEFKDILTTEIKLDEVKQIKEMEDELHEKNERLMDILKSTENDYRPYLRGGAGVNPKQFGQTFVAIGYKPDLNEDIISEPIVGNYVNGLKTVQDYYISAIGTTKSLITNFEKVEDSGYLTRKATLLNIDVDLDPDLYDCKTPNYVNAKITDETVLNRLKGRIYYDEDEDDFFIIEPGETDYLIGSTVKLRSPITCAGKKGVCSMCYGEHLSVINRSRHAGIISVLSFTAILTQLLLSSKHLLQAKSVYIDLGKEFDKFFVINRDTIILNPLLDKEDLAGYNIVVDPEDVLMDENNPGRYFTMKYKVVKKSSNEEYTIDSIYPLNLFNSIKDRLEAHLDEDNKYSMPLRKIDTEEGIFYMVINNIGLSSSLQAVLDLIDKKDQLGLTTIDGIYNKFIELLSLNDISLLSVHVEMIMYNLIRDANNVHQRPDFSKVVTEEDYKPVQISEAILNSDSIAASLSFQDVERQLWNPDSYAKKGASKLDNFYVN